ncbi:YbaB/EbfC family nucleoid-associated protein [Nocardia sp. NBC_00511]|uniref:YbaB/EbfC family nucleoid-associated protein n=1 Tax=Nocardia sp. NBC_00511 TaxID=2903591 RepID=UPI0030DEAA10
MSAEMDALLGRVNQQLAALEATLHGLAGVRARFGSPDGSVTAEVDADGALTGLWLAESVTSQPPAEVSRLILWACQQAAALATAQRSRIIADLNGSLSPGNVGAARIVPDATTG